MRVCDKCGHNLEPPGPRCPSCKREQPARGWPTDPLIGRSVGGRYRIERRLGVGGMGVVYRAVGRDGAAVAIKTLHTHLVQHDDMVRRFRREARSASMLEGPHTARVYETGELPDGTLFYVMELVEGRSLTRWLDQGALPVSVAVDLMKQLAEGIAEAHGLGLVHRDIKPDNLLVGEGAEGLHLCILDFGIVKVTDAAIGTVGATGTGKVFGTPEFMSPEQARGAQAVDLRTDIFSAGICFFAMLTGKLPYAGTPQASMMARMINEAPKLRSVRPALPEELEGIVARMLERDPDQRFQHMDEVLAALEEVAVAHAETTEMKRPERSPAMAMDTIPVTPELAPTLVVEAPATTLDPVKRPPLQPLLTGLGFVALMVGLALLLKWLG